MPFGLTIEKFQKIRNVFSLFNQVEKALIFGSRALDTYHEGSDIDLAIFGKDISIDLILKIRTKLENLPYGYSYDIIDYQKISNPDLKEQIDKFGLLFYEKKEITNTDWKEYKLGEITEPIKDTYRPDGNDNYYYIGLEHIEQGSLRLNSIGVSSDITSNKFLFKKNDVLFGKLRPYFRKVVKPQFDGICSTDIWVFRAKKDISQDFLYYFIANWEFVNTADSGENGTRMPRADWNFLEQTVWNIPPLPEQAAIAEVLSSLDDKIDLLHRQNKTLEAIAETLFRQWFVEEAEEGWEVEPLGNYITVKRGGSPRPIQDYLSDSGLRWLKISDVTGINSPFVFDIKEHIKEEGINKTVLLKSGSLILSNSATPGIPKILAVDTCVHDGWLYFPKSKFSNEFLYLLFLKIRPELLQQGNGSIFTNLKTDILKEYSISIPNNESLLFFDKQVKPIFDKIFKNTIQIRTLTQLRDTLLPKLMSGEVRVV